jgi:hypothetical protein
VHAWLHSGNEPDSHRHWIIGRARRRSLEAAVGSATFQAAWRFRHRSAGVQILFPAHDDDSRQRDHLDRALAVSALAPLLHVAEQQTRGEKEKRFPNVEVTFKKNAKVNDRICTVLEIRHPDQNPQFEFHLAQVFIDDELNIPIRYAAYGWPEADDELPVQEEYTYMKLKLNQGFTDKDFDTKNKKYNF